MTLKPYHFTLRLLEKISKMPGNYRFESLHQDAYSRLYRDTTSLRIHMAAQFTMTRHRFSSCIPQSVFRILSCMALLHFTAVQAADNTQQSTDGRMQTWSDIARLPDFTSAVWACCEPGAPNDYRGITPAPLKAPRSSSVVPAGETCLPIGVPAVMLRPYPFEFVFAPGRITLLLELDGQIRRIHTDGRGHPEDPDLTYGGHSIGHWEKDTLVVDTVGFLPEVQITAGVPANGPVHVIERMRLTAPDVLTIETRLEAPGALTQPWTYSMNYRRRHEWSIQEYFCVEGEGR